MSKIQITELNKTASEFNTLNAQETTEVVGGYYNYNNIYQSIANYNLQLAYGGNGGDGGDAYYYGDGGDGGNGGDANNYNWTNQQQYGTIYN